MTRTLYDSPSQAPISFASVDLPVASGPTNAITAASLLFALFSVIVSTLIFSVNLFLHRDRKHQC
ncbi:hypothetical protein [Photobacterium lipolyticum]|uniref:hypothetical protein n=1 Tax=Photobacterium lipolyticum TaxID=266810 RepID=UPI001475147F|nr:hypothetical protein [Photobacterium lipolyticum]